MAGNEYQTEAMTGRYDASYGIVFLGDGKGNFKPVSSLNSGFIIDGDVKNMKLINKNDKGKIIIAAVNNEKMKCLALNIKPYKQ